MINDLAQSLVDEGYGSFEQCMSALMNESCEENAKRSLIAGSVPE